MKKKQMLILLVPLVFMLAASCVQEEKEAPTLVLSESFLEFGKEAGEASLTVTTNQESWDAFAMADWMTLSQNCGVLTVRAAANPASSERQGIVVVRAGAAVKQVGVTQRDAGLVVQFTGDTLAFDSFPSTRTVRLAVNAEHWTVEAQSDWLTVVPVPARDEMTLSVLKNPMRTERREVVTLRADGKTRELEVVQEGIPYYILPLLQQPASFGEIERFEVGRHSGLVWGEYGSQLKYFDTPSPAFPRIVYASASYEDGALHSNWNCWIDVTVSGREAVDSPDFDAFLRANGFAPDGRTEASDGYDAFWFNEWNRFTAFLRVRGRSAHLQYYYNPVQPEPHAAQDSLSLPYLDFETGYADAAKPWVRKYEAVQAWEAEHGGVFIAKHNDDFDYINFYQPGLSQLMREYCFSYRTPFNLKQVNLYYEDIGEWVWKSPSRFYYVTDECAAMLRKQGFVPDPDHPNPFECLFVNPDLNIRIYVTLDQAPYFPPHTGPHQLTAVVQIVKWK